MCLVALSFRESGSVPRSACPETLRPAFSTASCLPGLLSAWRAARREEVRRMLRTPDTTCSCLAHATVGATAAVGASGNISNALSAWLFSTGWLCPPEHRQAGVHQGWSDRPWARESHGLTTPAHRQARGAGYPLKLAFSINTAGPNGVPLSGKASEGGCKRKG